MPRYFIEVMRLALSMLLAAEVLAIAGLGAVVLLTRPRLLAACVSEGRIPHPASVILTST